MNEPKNSGSAGGNSPGALIYVVDDEPMLLELATVILEPLGYTVRTFRDPDLALSSYTAAKPRPALLITDYAMHQMNGLALMEACRKLQPRQRVLLISGTVDQEVYRHARIKPDRFLPKPYTARQLADFVKQMVQGLEA